MPIINPFPNRAAPNKFDKSPGAFTPEAPVAPEQLGPTITQTQPTTNGAFQFADTQYDGGAFLPWGAPGDHPAWQDAIGPLSGVATGAAQDLSNATLGTINPAAQQIGAFGTQLQQNPFDFGGGVQDFYNLLTQSQSPNIQNGWNTLTNDIFQRGQYGSVGTAGDQQLQSFGRGVSQADAANLIQAMQFGQSGRLAGANIGLQALQPQLGAFNQAQIYPNALQWQTGLPLQLQLGAFNRPDSPSTLQTVLGGVASGAGAYLGAL